MKTFHIIEIALLIFLCFAVVIQHLQIRKILRSYGAPEFKPDNIKRTIAGNAECLAYVRSFLAATDKELDDILKSAMHYDNCSEWNSYARAAKMRALLREKQMADHHVT